MLNHHKSRSNKN